MTVSLPVVGPTTIINGQFISGLAPLPNVQPFTYRSGATYQTMLEEMRAWIEYTLIPFLNENTIEEAFETQVTLLTNAVNEAIADDKAAVDAAIAQAVIDFANAHVDVTDPIILAVLNNAQSATLAWLKGHYAPAQVLYAPAPSGTDDTAAIQALIDQAMTSDGIGSGPGKVILGPGTYKGNFTLSGGFWKAKVVGQGKQATYVQSLDATKPVFHVQGGSGSFTSGSIEDLTVVGTSTSSPTTRNGIGIELQGVGGFMVERVQYTNLAVGHRWKNDGLGEFTEFCVCRDINMNYVVLPFEYSGAGSFHGSGIDGNSTLGLQSDVNSFMQIDTGCTVYNAPLSITLFTDTNSTSGNFIVNQSGGPAFFYGNLRSEIFGGDWTYGWPGGGNVYYCGTINTWSHGPHLGIMFLVEKVSTAGTTIIPVLKPWNTKQTLNTGTTPIMGGAPILGPGTYDCSIEVFGPNNYWYSYTVRCWNSGTSVPPHITVVDTHYTNDPGSIGAPTFAWNNGLTITNNAFDNNFTVSATYSCKIHVLPGDNLGQY